MVNFTEKKTFTNTIFKNENDCKISNELYRKIHGKTIKYITSSVVLATEYFCLNSKKKTDNFVALYIFANISAFAVV